MPLSIATGNMYTWVTNMWNILIGACSHDCSYCYVKASTKRFPKTKAMYEGPCRLNPKDSNINLGVGKKIFVAHTSDLFAKEVPDDIIHWVLDRCNMYPHNEYVIQTKNPARMLEFLYKMPKENFELGTTVETDDVVLLQTNSKAPEPVERVISMGFLKSNGYTTFITIEPIMKMIDPKKFGELLVRAKPDFINIGADSKKSKLPEPTWDEIEELKGVINNAGIEIKIKTNLDRLKPKVKV
jgi:DNA repair photolyase